MNPTVTPKNSDSEKRGGVFITAGTMQRWAFSVVILLLLNVAGFIFSYGQMTARMNDFDRELQETHTLVLRLMEGRK
jgi:hypothetical protein